MARAEIAAGDIHGALISHRKYQHRIAWKGSRVPRHVSIGDTQDTLTPIVWAQHGLVYCGESQDHVGEYTRVVDCGGEKGDQQEMIIYADLECVTSFE